MVKKKASKPARALPDWFRLSRRKRVAVLRLEGVLSSSTRSQTLNMRRYAPIIDQFLRGSFVQHVVVVNSPGGSPSQSEAIATELRERAAYYKRKLVVYVEDVAASGGYWLACAGDEIVAQPSSVVGSVGVIAAGFGFDRLIARWDIDRRAYVAGDNKLRLDPFQAEKPDDVAFIKELQQQIHQQFIAWVKSRRGQTLKSKDEILFNGDVWLGAEAQKIGIVDRVGYLHTEMRKKHGKDIKFVWFAPRTRFFDRVGRTFSNQIVSAVTDVAKEQQQWQRFTLFG